VDNEISHQQRINTKHAMNESPNEIWFKLLPPAKQAIILAAARLALQDDDMMSELNISHTEAYRLVEDMDTKQLGAAGVTAKTFQFETVMKGVPKFKAHTEFLPAWIDMYEYVNQRLADGNLTHQELETALWIEVVDGKSKAPILFYDARDRAIRDHGWEHEK
jgi:hypothetical protein